MPVVRARPLFDVLEEGVRIRARLPRREIARFADYLVAESAYRFREAETK